MKIGVAEIQPFNYCNRRCSFCNVFKDGISGTPKQYIDKDLILSKLEDGIHLFDKTIIFSVARYCEPFYDIDFVLELMYDMERIFLKNNRELEFHVYTNGDLINVDNLNKLITSGLLRVLHVSLYDKTLIDALELMELVEYDAESKVVFKENSVIYINKKYNSKLRIKYNKNNNIKISNRGGSLYFTDRKKENLKECKLVDKNLNIDYNGIVMPCCDTHSSTHSDIKIGDLNTDTLEDIVKNIENFNKDNRHCNSCDREGGFDD